MTRTVQTTREKKFHDQHARSHASVRERRLIFGTLVGLTITAMLWLMVTTLSQGGYHIVDLALTLFFAITLPWTVVGFWNAVVGLVIMRATFDPAGHVFSGAATPHDKSPITSSTAILLCVRNEDVSKVARNLGVMVEGLVDAGFARHFHAYVLSDSDSGEIAEAEEVAFEGLRSRWDGIFPVTYRRRGDNAGFKAGNISDFCKRWGKGHDYALVLDADSLMSGKTILRMVRTMQRNPRLGILQSLVVGMPTVSAFARPFQFGMRLGMRSYTLGSAWWQADCGPYWGHNALLRLEPFMHHCKLPKLRGRPPLGGWILSHDQVEAVLMRKAGYEVRVLPEEGGSWEENPPTLLEYIRRDLRWCHGNMQYWRLLTLPGLKPVSRLQLLLAILMFIGSPAWIAFVSLGLLRIGLSDDFSQTVRAETGLLLLACIMTMVFAPKLATMVDIISTNRNRNAFGGAASVGLSALSEIVFSTLVAPVIALAHTRFLLGLPLGRTAVWSAQRRSTHAVTMQHAFKRLWPQTLLGLSLAVSLLVTAPAALTGFLPFLLGWILAVPIALVSSWERLGMFLTRSGIWQIPDELAPAPELQALQLPALRPARSPLSTSRPALNTARRN